MKKLFSASNAAKGAAFYLRYLVFVLEQEIDPKDEFDSLDQSGRFYLVYFDQTLPVATVRYQKKDNVTLQPDRLCVHPDYRKHGLGTKLLQEIEQRAVEEGCTIAVLSAEYSAVPFYEKNHYILSSDSYYEDGILCVEMKKELAPLR